LEVLDLDLSQVVELYTEKTNNILRKSGFDDLEFTQGRKFEDFTCKHRQLHFFEKDYIKVLNSLGNVASANSHLFAHEIKVVCSIGNLRCERGAQKTSSRHFSSVDIAPAEKIVYIFLQDLSKRKHCQNRCPADFSYE
jgi:hypothetical protein